MSDSWPGDTELSDEIPEDVDEEGPGEDDDGVRYCQQHQGPVLTGSVYLRKETYTLLVLRGDLITIGISWGA